jgi:pyrroline-5-carboxylate reductase
LLVSIAAGLPLSRLCSWFGHSRVIRTMPNTPLLVGYGATVFTCAEAVSDADREFVRRIFGALGTVHEMPETAMDAVTALSGSGPAYMFEMVQALVDAGAAVGLEAEAAFELVTQTMAGAAAMLKRGMGTPEELRIAVTSPGGTTAAGLGVLQAAGFRELLQQTVRAARDRSIELGRDS